LPCQFADGVSAQTLGLTGDERFDLVGIEGGITPRQKATLRIHRKDGRTDEAQVTVRIDTPIEVDYYRSGGILPYVLKQIVARG
jgi:aconitate hydratase